MSYVTSPFSETVPCQSHMRDVIEDLTVEFEGDPELVLEGLRESGSLDSVLYKSTSIHQIDLPNKGLLASSVYGTVLDVPDLVPTLDVRAAASAGFSEARLMHEIALNSLLTSSPTEENTWDDTLYANHHQGVENFSRLSRGRESDFGMRLAIYNPIYEFEWCVDVGCIVDVNSGASVGLNIFSSPCVDERMVRAALSAGNYSGYDVLSRVMSNAYVNKEFAFSLLKKMVDEDNGFWDDPDMVRAISPALRLLDDSFDSFVFLSYLFSVIGDVSSPESFFYRQFGNDFNYLSLVPAVVPDLDGSSLNPSLGKALVVEAVASSGDEGKFLELVSRLGGDVCEV